ncbi:MAG: COG1361 S-layer family protein [Anaerovoracaceae bacterium]
MKEITKKILAMVLCVLLVMSTGILAFADETGDNVIVTEEPDNDEIKVIPSDANALVLMDAGAQSPKGTPGEVVTVVLTMAVNREYLPTEKYMLRNITVEPNIPKDASVSKWPFDIINASYVRHLDDMSYNSTADVYYDFRISEFATEGVYPLNFTVNATVWREDPVNGTTITEDVKFNLGVWVTVIGDGSLSGITTNFGPLQLAGRNDTGKTIESPIASPGETVTLKVPVINKGGYLTDVTITPVVSSSLEEFPFVADSMNYGCSFSRWSNDTVKTLEYTFKVSDFATTGNKSIKFRATYYENGTPGECTFSAYIYIKNGYEETPETAPSLMVTGYKLFVNEAEVSRLTAGDNAVLRLQIKNNAAYDTVYKNVATLTIADSKTLNYTIGYSDSAYVRSIKPGATAEMDFYLTVRNDAEVGTTSVGITMTYETYDAIAGKATQSIMIPVSQPMDIVIDSPMVYGTPTIDSPTAISLNLVNMGRAKALNVRIMATDGLAMNESYYGGDLLAGGTLSADIEVNPNKIGEFVGKLIVSYEDANGQLYSQEILVPMNVSEETPLVPAENVYDSSAEKSGLPWWIWLIIIILVILLVVFVVLNVLVSKKKKETEENENVGYTEDFGLDYVEEDTLGEEQK